MRVETADLKEEFSALAVSAKEAEERLESQLIIVEGITSRNSTFTATHTRVVDVFIAELDELNVKKKEIEETAATLRETEESFSAMDIDEVRAEVASKTEEAAASLAEMAKEEAAAAAIEEELKDLAKQIKDQEEQTRRDKVENATKSKYLAECKIAQGEAKLELGEMRGKVAEKEGALKSAKASLNAEIAEATSKRDNVVDNLQSSQKQLKEKQGLLVAAKQLFADHEEHIDLLKVRGERAAIVRGCVGG